MWPSTFNKKCATISGWQSLGDFAAVKQQLMKIRSSTRGQKQKEDGGGAGGGGRPLPPVPTTTGPKSVRFSLPGTRPGGSSSEGSDQGYESDPPRVTKDMPDLIILKNASKIHRVYHVYPLDARCQHCTLATLLNNRVPIRSSNLFAPDFCHTLFYNRGW